MTAADRTGDAGAGPDRQERHLSGWGLGPALVGAVARRPGLWPTATRQLVRLAAPGWWRRWPPVPRPDPGWLAFRLKTAYGDAVQAPEPDDVVTWLIWCRDYERLRYSRRR